MVRRSGPDAGATPASDSSAERRARAVHPPGRLIDAMGVLEWLEGSALGVWTRESPSIWAYPTILTLHTIGLGILVGASAVVDFTLLGFAPRLPVATLSPLFRFMWFGLALNAVTGVVLFIAQATMRAHQVVFFVKLVLVALAVANA